MKTLRRDDHIEARLRGLRLGLEHAAHLTRTGRLGAADLRVTVEAQLEQLRAAIHETNHSEPERQRLLATLDAVASHVWAAVDAAVSGVRTEVVANLFQRAAEHLSALPVQIVP